MSSRLQTLGGFAPEFFARAGAVASIGTHAYPPAIRRRLQSLNVGSFTVAVSCLLFAITYALEDAALYRDAVLVNLALMLISLSVPAFHRINEIAGVLLMTISFYLGLLLLVALVGRESGIQVNFIAASVALFPILGLGRLRLIAALIVVAIVLHVASWLIFRNGTVDADPSFLLQLYATVVATISVIIAVIVYYAFWIAEHAEAETEALLHRILPASVAERLKAEPDAAISDSFSEASVLFSDIVGFVPITRELGPARTVAMLNDLVHSFDRLAAAHGVEKIKTIGDSWMAAAGVPTPVPDHAARLARVALGMQALADDAGARHGVRLRLRIGIALGPVMAGVIGASRFGYDIWGDAVNLAARLESSGEPDRIHVSDAYQEALAEGFAFTPRGATAIKGVGLEDTWFLVGERFG